MRTILTFAALTLAIASVPATADAQAAKHHTPPLMPMGFAQHDAWETMNDYAEAQADRWSADVDEEQYSCRRVRRSVVDCKTSMVFWTSDGGERHSWTMRYRAGQAAITVHMERYFPSDRYASTDPTDERFGGLALRTRTV